MRTMETPKISLIICAHNEEKGIGECLDTAIKNSGGKFSEIIVIDNASTDHTKEEAEKRPGVRVVYEPNKGLTHARQRGLTEANGDLVAYLDADTLLTPHWLPIAIKIFSENKDVVSLSGPPKYYGSSYIKDHFLYFVWWLVGPITYRIVGYMVFGADFIARKKALLDIGGFDTKIEFYGEDTDIARRLSAKGKAVFRMDMFIYTSSRRFQHEGITKTLFVYGLNYIWPVLFHRPFTKAHQDVRHT